MRAFFFALLMTAACDEEGVDVPADDPSLLPGDELPPPPVITQVGTCPGPVTFTITSLTPGGTYRVGRSPNLGPGTPITTAPCAGTTLRIGPPTTLVARGTAPPSGTATYSVITAPAICGHYLQVQDVATCTTSFWHQIF
jgi:hypothetical protein